MQELLLAQEGGGLMSTLPMLLVMAGIFYFLIIRPQKKREKQAKEMRDSLEVGDEILTVGGILGRVVSIREESDSLLIETGSANTKIRISRGAVQSNLSALEKQEKEKEAKQAALPAADKEKEPEKKPEK